MSRDKIRKARSNVANKKPPPQQQAQLRSTLSEASRSAIGEIAKQMESAVGEPAPSEDPNLGIPEDQILDPIFRDMPMPPPLSVASVARRKEIETRCSELRIDDLFVSGELRQLVQIRKGKLEIIYRTLKGKEDLYIKRRLSEVRDEVARYAEDRFLYMLMAAHVHAYNGKELPSMTDEDGTIKDVLFDKRFGVVCDIPQILLEELWVNYRWFEDRIRGALEAENLKDG